MKVLSWTLLESPIEWAFLVQLLGDEALPVLQPIVEKLLQGDDKNKQRGAAEFMAGIIGGESTIFMELYNH